MKTYTYNYIEDNKTFSVNFKAEDIHQAIEIATITGWKLKGEKVFEWE
jgi:flavin reductase (DIM6/NTAB) family NADH-FMN oxidoreductase RutF